MKVAFLSRSTLFSSPGGDTIQLEQTAASLRKIGVSVDIRLAHEQLQYAAYDLIHFFNIIRPADLLRHARKASCPIVLSTIFVDYSEYDKNYRKGMVGWLSRTTNRDTVEFVKAIARRIKNGEPINSRSYLWRGHRNSIRYLLNRSASLLPNSHSEYQRLVRDYGVERPYRVIPNAIDTDRFGQTAIPTPSDRKGLLAVGRIEQYKNQLALIQAIRNSDYSLTIVGKPAANHLDYYEECQRAAGENVAFVPHLPQEELVAWYLKARVHVVPSWFETTGLSNLEAGVLGCQLVITDRGDTTEYFQEDAFYCEPDSVASIRAAIDQAYRAPFSENLRERILNEYTWDRAASKTKEAYEWTLNHIKAP